MLYSHEDALIDTRESINDRAEYLLTHHLEQRERYASMRASTQLFIDMGKGALPLDLDVRTPREEMLGSIKNALALRDESVKTQRAALTRRRHW